MMQIETHVDSFVRNCWYVAAWEDEISADSVFERTLLGEVHRLLSRFRCPRRCA